MLRIAILTARSRLGLFAGALLAFFASAVLVMAGGMLLQAALNTHAPVERYAGAAAVVTGPQRYGTDHDVVLDQPPRVNSALVTRLAAVPGVRAAIGDVSVPAHLGQRAAVVHGWASSRLTPYALTGGRAPMRPGEVVTGYPARLGAHLTFASTEAARTLTVVGVARPRHAVHRQAAIFLTDVEAARLAGPPGRVHAFRATPAASTPSAPLRPLVSPPAACMPPRRLRQCSPEPHAAPPRPPRSKLARPG